MTNFIKHIGWQLFHVPPLMTILKNIPVLKCFSPVHFDCTPWKTPQCSSCFGILPTASNSSRGIFTALWTLLKQIHRQILRPPKMLILIGLRCEFELSVSTENWLKKSPYLFLLFVTIYFHALFILSSSLNYSWIWLNSIFLNKE